MKSKSMFLAFALLLSMALFAITINIHAAKELPRKGLTYMWSPSANMTVLCCEQDCTTTSCSQIEDCSWWY
jgi:hypothetical protein